MEKPSAEELMLTYQQKSPELAILAFEELYRRYSSKVFSFLVSKCKNQADAEDLLQKVFIKVHESKHLYKNLYKFEQWIFVIARTTLLDHFRSSKRYESRLAKQEFQGKEQSVEAADSDFFDGLGSLKADQKEMLEMKYIDELTYQEMAAHFNKSEGSLRKMMSRLVGNLKKGEV